MIPNRNQNVGHGSPVVTIRKDNFWSLELFPVVKKGWALRIKRNCYFGIRHVGLLSQFLSGSKIQPDVLIGEMEHFKYMPAYKTLAISQKGQISIHTIQTRPILSFHWTPKKKTMSSLKSDNKKNTCFFVGHFNSIPPNLSPKKGPDTMSKKASINLSPRWWRPRVSIGKVGLRFQNLVERCITNWRTKKRANDFSEMMCRRKVIEFQCAFRS